MVLSVRYFARMFLPLLPFFCVSVYAEDGAPTQCALPQEKLVALTFDDGPSPKTTPEILKILNQYNAKATFFVVGKNAQRFKSLMMEIHQAGHELGNHTYSHPILTKVSRDRVHGELEVTNKIIAESSGAAPTLFRPPYGSINQRVRDIASELGMETIMWTEDTKDWSRNATPVSIENKVMLTLHNGSVVLMHDNHKATIEALPVILKKMQDQGYKFVTIHELKTEQAAYASNKASVCRMAKSAIAQPSAPAN